MQLRKLMEVYKVVRASVDGLDIAAKQFNLPVSLIRQQIQSKDRIYSRSRFTIAQCLPIWYLHESGYTINEICQMTYITKSTVMNILKHMKTNGDQEVNSDLVACNIETIAKLREKGYTYNELAIQFETTIDNIKMILEPYQTLPKHVGGRRAQVTDEEIQRMRRLRDKGMSYNQIATTMKRSVSTIHAYVNFPKEHNRKFNV